ncbi:M20 family metallo-hydrolase [Nesterenkonia sp. NBAIMH1]|uniref:M20 family metallo-hydrolase n=1 Tax=Nesterenkonia sp. NBAIMH1 TaxID=2600320 RepID=UPI0011B531FD|nr:M20 family metallo-hydrolase [Nesterenkonia sp. NBAIMH1]
MTRTSFPAESGAAAFLNADAFLKDFQRTADFGATPNQGIDRQAGTAEHGAVRDWFAQKAERRGFSVKTDPIGNIFALKEFVPGEPYILLGSHLDSQPQGGRFDGAYGVIAAFHAALAVEKAVEAGLVPSRFNLAVVDWFNEEGARFGPSIMGSSVYTGALQLEEALNVRDADGISVRSALRDTGRLGEPVEFHTAVCVEIHIEQGRRLERSGAHVGIVERNWTAQKLLVHVRGEQAHAGALLADRRDALLAAAEVVTAAHREAHRHRADEFITSVAKFDVHPNSPSVIARQVDLLLDVRGLYQKDVESARSSLIAEFGEISKNHNVDVDVEEFTIRPSQPYTAAGVELAEQVAHEEGLTPQRLTTLIGHDSVALNRIYPTVMLFVPSADGISHCEREFSSDSDMLNGLRLVTGLVSRLVQHGILDEGAE